MLIGARRLLVRARAGLPGQLRTREVALVRGRFAAAQSPELASADELALAVELRRLREALAAAFGAVESCRGCAHGHPLPHGRWDGGHCCGTRTELVFTDDEVAALRLGGTSAASLVPPEGDMAGCAFRGSDGCSLAAADRPNLCVRFVCRELEDELRERGDLADVKAIAGELARAFERWRKLRATRAPALEPWDDA